MAARSSAPGVRCVSTCILYIESKPPRRFSKSIVLLTSLWFCYGLLASYLIDACIIFYKSIILYDIIIDRSKCYSMTFSACPLCLFLQSVRGLLGRLISNRLEAFKKGTTSSGTVNCSCLCQESRLAPCRC